MLSVLSWAPFSGATSHGAATAAQRGLTNALRVELAGQDTVVTALHLGAADTDVMAGRDMPKTAPGEVVRLALDGIEAGALEVLADEPSPGQGRALLRPSSAPPHRRAPLSRARQPPGSSVASAGAAPLRPGDPRPTGSAPRSPGEGPRRAR